MSVNNQLVIIKKRDKFCVYENLCVDNDFIPDEESLLKSSLTLNKAIKYANEYCQEYPDVEHGYSIDDSCLEEK